MNSEEYNRGWIDGREGSRQEFEQAYLLLSKHANDLLLENHELRELAFGSRPPKFISWIKRLIGNKHDRKRAT